MIDSPNLTYVNEADESGGIFFMHPGCLTPEEIYYTNDDWQFWRNRRKDNFNYWEINRFTVY